MINSGDMYMNPTEQNRLTSGDDDLEALSGRFNSFFLPVFTYDDSALPNFKEASGAPRISNIAFTEQGVLNLLLHIDNKKCPEPDRLPNEFLCIYEVWLLK